MKLRSRGAFGDWGGDGGGCLGRGYLLDNLLDRTQPGPYWGQGVT